MKALVLFLSLFPFAAQAGDSTHIHCVTKKRIEDRSKGMTEIDFRIKNLESGKLEILGDDENPIKQTPEDSVLDINDNLEYSRSKEGNLVIKSDGDGETATTVTIYKDSGFHTGFAAVKFAGSGHKEAASSLACTVN